MHNTVVDKKSVNRVVHDFELCNSNGACVIPFWGHIVDDSGYASLNKSTSLPLTPIADAETTPPMLYLAGDAFNLPCFIATLMGWLVVTGKLLEVTATVTNDESSGSESDDWARASMS